MVFILVQCISSGVILYAIALILIQILPISIVEAIVYITLFTACYTYAGGISTVIWTDMLQSAVLIAGSVAIFVLLLLQVDGVHGVSREQLNIINLQFDLGVDTTLWAGVVAVSFLHMSVYGTNQLIIQRTLATRCEKRHKVDVTVRLWCFFIYFFFALLGVLLSIFIKSDILQTVMK